MAETLVETAVCSACGADVREESVFCYNCGAPVVSRSPGDVPVADRVLETAPPSKETAIAHRTNDARPPLRSAASLRKQRRASNRQPVEVSWEPTTRSPVAFIITTVVLASAALVLLVLALYLR